MNDRNAGAKARKSMICEGRQANISRPRKAPRCRTAGISIDAQIRAANSTAKIVTDTMSKNLNSREKGASIDGTLSRITAMTLSTIRTTMKWSKMREARPEPPASMTV